MAEFALESRAFENAQAIPARFSCEGEDVSPSLRWSNVPEGTRSLALVADDPDAPGGVFTHWLGWGLDPAGEGLGEGSRRRARARMTLAPLATAAPARLRATAVTATSSASTPSTRSSSLAPVRRRLSWSGQSRNTC
jgi:Phosphatidylethanolamine-binding protein